MIGIKTNDVPRTGLSASFLANKVKRRCSVEELTTMLTTEDGCSEEEHGFLESPYREEGHKESVEASRAPRSQSRPPIFYLRLLLELAMAGTIAVLLARQSISPAKPSAVPQCMCPWPLNRVKLFVCQL